MDVLNGVQRKPVRIAYRESIVLFSCNAALVDLITCLTYRPMATRSAVVNTIDEICAATWDPANRIGCLMSGTLQ